ncbi:MAG: HNH endonuclease [Planctomycetaceae bacterium]
MKKRPPLPADLERQVLVEAGHRCAIPTCRQTPVEVAHIERWSRCQEHRFHNLISLCPTCHTRYDSGEIDRKSMLTYKRQLWIVNRRYSDFEWRLMRRLNDSRTDCWLWSDFELAASQVLDDGFVSVVERLEAVVGAGLTRCRFAITAAGREFILQWPVNTETLDLRS